MPNNLVSFNTKQDLLQKMAELAKENSILKIISNNDQIISFVCENNQCEAIINGVYNSNCGKYFISRCNTNHKCSLNSEVVYKCILNYININHTMSISELTTKLMEMNYAVGYFEAYAFHTFNYYFNSNLTNINVSDIFGNVEFLIKNCIKTFEKEFNKKNTSNLICTRTEDNYFYMTNKSFNIFRPVREIKVYDMPFFTLILGISFDANDDAVIASIYIEHKKNSQTKNKHESISNFIKNERKFLTTTLFDDFQKSDNGSITYLVEYDASVIESLMKLNVNFFIKSRSIVNFIDTQTEFNSEIDILDIFLYLNYDTKREDIKYFLNETFKGINLNIKNYIRYNNENNLYFLNNKAQTEFDFINEDMCQMDMFDFLNLLLWHMKEDLECRQGEYDENVLSENAMEIIQYNASMNIQNRILDESESTKENVNNDNSEINRIKTCECSKYTEFGVPCVHMLNDFSINTGNEQEKLEVSDICLYSNKYYHKHQIKNVQGADSLIPMGPGMYRKLRFKIKEMTKKST